MTNRPAYISDEELVKQFQSLLRATPPAGSQQPPTREQVEEARSLAAEFAERIYDDPDKWGLTAIPDAFRDDAAGDALVSLFYAALDMRGRKSVAEWFTGTVESKFRRLWAVAERQDAERALRANEQPSSPPEPEPLPPAAGSDIAPSLFEDESSIWPGFEDSFPRDAFALRLRYHLKRNPAEMAVMLDAPSARAITMRVDRARDRFRMYCEQQGVNRRDLTDMVAQVSEESAA